MIYLYGCGGHAKVILDIFDKQNRQVTGLVHDSLECQFPSIHGVPVFHSRDILPSINPSEAKWIVAIGNNLVRKKIANKLEALNFRFINAIHPSAQIALGVQLSPGTVVMANSVINTDTVIGWHCIINTGATIDHDCQVNDFVHIAPGCSLCGGVHVSEGTILGVGTVVKPGMSIGSWTVCGAGSVIVKSVPPSVLAYGCPADVRQYLND